MVRLIDLGMQKLEVMLSEMAKEAINSMNMLASFKKGETARQLKEISRKLKRLKEEVGEIVLEIIARYQPMASDLRFVKSSLEISYDLYRISRYSYDIALALDDADVSLEECMEPEVQENMLRVKEMLDLAIKSILGKEEGLAYKIKQMDQQVDKAYRDYFNKALEFKGGRCTVANLLIMRYLERLADHCSYIADEVLFIVKGIYEQE
jgi:phosphate transport system protein